MTRDKKQFTTHRSRGNANKTQESFRPIEESSRKKDEKRIGQERERGERGGEKRGEGGGGESFGLERASRGLKFQSAKRAFISIRRS